MSKSKGKSIKIQAEKYTLAITSYLAPWQTQRPGREMGPPAKDTEPKPEQEMQPTLRTISETLATKERDHVYLQPQIRDSRWTTGRKETKNIREVSKKEN